MTSDTDFGPWINWPGGERPIPAIVRHEVRYRNNFVSEGDRPEARDWLHGGAPWDIMAYRVRKAAPDLLAMALDTLRIVQPAIGSDTIIGVKICAVLALAEQRGL